MKNKFRAWHPLLERFSDVFEIGDFPSWRDSSGSGYVSFEPCEKIYCQCTGLKDKNGKDIYEGDIIKFAAYKSNPDGEHRIGVLVYSKGGYFFEYKQNNIIANFVYGIEKSRLPQCYIEWAVEHDGICEILGNIYENPELIGNITSGK